MTIANIQKLKTLIDGPEYQGVTDTDVVTRLNAKTIPYYIEVPTPDLTNFLFNSGLYSKLLAAYRDHPDPRVRVASEGALDLAQSQISKVNVENTAIKMTLPVLVAGNVWSQPEADSVLAYARRYTSIAQRLLEEDVLDADVRAARNYDFYVELREREALLGEQVNDLNQERAVLQGKMIDVLNGLDVEDN